jgi:DedD protein
MKEGRHTSGMAKHSAMLDPNVDSGDMYGYEESSFSIPKALSLFFGVVLMAGIFFSGGYHMGHSAGLTQAMAGAPAPLASPAYSGKEKPAAALEATPEATEPVQSTTEPIMTENAAAVAPPVKASKSGKAEATTGTFTVQVAAVRHQEDAEALLGALRKKQYPVFLASANSDSLFHVQVGPFPNQKDADSMRARLSGDGYNAIVKK